MSLAEDEVSPPESEIYDDRFGMQLMYNGIWRNEFPGDDGRVPAPPRNVDAINQRLSRRRASLTEWSFSEADFKRFRHIAANSGYKGAIRAEVLPTIWGERDRHASVLGQVGIFVNIAPFSQEWPLPLATPDYFHGACSEHLNFEILEKIHDQIIPWRDVFVEAPLAPNFFVEVGNPDHPTAVCFRKATYAGAIGCRAVQALQSSNRRERFYDDKAYTITVTYASGMLTLYAHHAIPHVPDAHSSRPSDYIMTQLGAWSMIHDAATFRQGATAFRNALDWTAEELEKAIISANQRERALWRHSV
ncbi:hypothetical protein BO78DRAFT_309673 [Aspergillus sclerotiicarbonarius CBS 121057]|uniref:Uncharacterized protein n=1 Tax=Aspergillus sclerotiicarbonarius (strain CBS 121057 / IBT 28362) TaxID=1448318 RepID=A0A319FKY0_ASPSB|nr:hypothetical protein BO78DRAFT_309673 [Aspergillus sclerotiicarbonarius CBS 121057]